jgi:hypothetical protein
LIRRWTTGLVANWDSIDGIPKRVAIRVEVSEEQLELLVHDGRLP